MTNLSGRLAAVTGASRGAGEEEVADSLGEAGATVYVMGLTTQEGSAALAGLGLKSIGVFDGKH